MFKRRSLLAFGAASLSALAVGQRSRTVWADTPAEGADFFSPELPDMQQLGTHPPLPKEDQMGQQIIAACPKGPAPIDIMNWFVALNSANDDGELYRGGWRTRWNPIIVTFFRETGTKPSGDTTPWCAASMNWVLARCGYRGTGSASSGSFRDHSGSTSSPQPGDVVVFRQTDPVEARLGHGHVTLFLSWSGDQISCIGGNQVNSRGHHEFSIEKIRDGGFLTLHGSYSINAFK